MNSTWRSVVPPIRDGLPRFCAAASPAAVAFPHSFPRGARLAAPKFTGEFDLPGNGGGGKNRAPLNWSPTAHARHQFFSF
jgi:hypothetical protein